MRGSLSLFSLAAGVLSVMSACSPDSGDSSGSAGSAGSSGAGGGASGTAKYACYFDAGKQCTQASAPAAAVAQAQANCMMVGGVSSETCPTANLIGCCVNSGASCYYTGLSHDAAKLTESCAKGGGTWAATAP